MEKKTLFFYILIFGFSLFVFSESINVLPSQTVNVGAELTFTVIDSDLRANYQCNWDFGDGATTNNSKVVTHVYKNPGTYTVICTYNSNTLTTQIVVNENRSIGVTGSDFKVGDTIDFTANDFNTSSNLRWDFGDGTTENGGANKSHVYTREGHFQVKVYDFNGTATVPVTLDINIAPDTRDFSFSPSNPTLYQEITFNAIGFAGANLSWDFGDGTVQTGGLQMKHTYARMGRFDVKVQTVGSAIPPVKKAININRDIRKIEVIPFNVRLGQPVTIKLANVSNTAVVKWKIGNTYLPEIQQTIKYTFYDPGSYEIKCEISGQTPLVKRLKINASRRVIYNPRKIYNNSDITFEAVNFFGNQIKWDFGDGTIISQFKRVSHNFKNPGFYEVKVYDFNGKSKIPVKLRINVELDRRVLKTNVRKLVKNAEIEFRALNFGSSNLKWDFGDGTIINAGNVVKHVYKRIGLFTVKAYDFGGRDTKAIKLKINVANDNRVVSIPRELIEGENYEFSIKGIGVNDVKWEIVGMKPVIGSKVKVKFPRAGNYRIRIIDTTNTYPAIKKSIPVKQDLRKIYLVKSEVIIKDKFSLSLNQFKGNVKVDFGDGTKTIVNGNNVSHIYKKPGKYVIKAIDNNGKSSKIFTKVVIVKELSSDFSITTLELKFEDGKYYKVIPKKSLPPDFILRIKANGMGLIRGKWKIDGITLGLFSEFIRDNTILELKGNKTPRIPINEIGLHKVEVEFVNYKFNKKPFLRYFVSIGGGIRTIYPDNGSKIVNKKNVVLKWKISKKKYDYEIAVSEIPFHYLRDNQIKWKKLGYIGEYKLSLKKFKNDWIYWQVRKLDSNGRVITTSEINYFKNIKE